MTFGCFAELFKSLLGQFLRCFKDFLKVNGTHSPSPSRSPSSSTLAVNTESLYSYSATVSSSPSFAIRAVERGGVIAKLTRTSARGSHNVYIFMFYPFEHCLRRVLYSKTGGWLSLTKGCAHL